MHRHWRKAAFRLAALSIAVAVVIPAASGLAAETRTSAAPPQLVGKWTRKITSADVKRTGGYPGLAGAVCTLVIKKTGAASIACGTLAGFTGNIVRAGANRVHINLGTPSPDVYRWRVSRGLLTFTKVRDSEPDRVEAMVGTWKRR